MRTVVPERVFSPAALRAARLAADRTIREVAEAVGRTQKSIASYELGHSSPQVDVLEDIAAFLGGDVIAFFPLAGGGNEP